MTPEQIWERLPDSPVPAWPVGDPAGAADVAATVVAAARALATLDCVVELVRIPTLKKLDGLKI